MKVAIHLTNLNGGGAERATLGLASALADAGVDTDLLVCDANGPYRSILPENVRLVDFGGIGTFRSVFYIAHYLRKHRPDVLLCALNQPNSAGIIARSLAGTNTPIVITIHNTLSMEASHFSNWRRRLLPYFARILFPRANGLVAVSNGVAEDLAEFIRISKDRVTVIYNPVVTRAFKEGMKAMPDHPWFSDGGPPIIISVGRLTEQKDFSCLLEAFSLVVKRQPARLIILGEGEDRSGLEEKARALGLADYVDLPGFKPNPFPWMRDASLFALSSRWEGMPCVLIESLAAGTPFVSTDCPSGPSEILTDPSAGALVPVGSPQAMADEIVNMLGKTKKAPLDSTWALHTTEHILGQYLDYLKKLTGVTADEHVEPAEMSRSLTSRK